MAEVKETVIVTGAAGDIGHAIVERFLDRGCSVVGLDIDGSALKARQQALSQPAEYTVIEVDLTKPAAVEAAFSKINAKLPNATSVLVNNAGGISAHSLRKTGEAEWARDLDLNLTSAWRCMDHVMPGMIEEGRGVIINIASVNGLGVFGHPGYSVAKAGLIHLTKFAAVELGPQGIRALAICPGTVKTQAWLERQEKSPQIIDEALKWYPSRSASDPGDVARMVEFAALDAPSTLTGSVLTCDGGLSAGQDVVASAFCGEGL